MKWRGRVSNYILSSTEKGEKLHFTLIDPEKIQNTKDLKNMLKLVVDAGTDAILIGGSLQVYSDDVTAVAKLIEEFDKPSILFPGSIAGISPYADAVLFISLLNSDNIYYVIGAQVAAAPIIRRFKLEVLPTGYIIVGSFNTSVSFMGRARPIPRNKPVIAAAYALTAKYMGMKFVYLEAGSGARKCVPPEVVSSVKKAVEDMAVIVGGGIKDSEKALMLANAGADIIVTGTIVEKDVKRALEIISKLKHK
ncbi:MAG: geranylgeranylglyceryl/heptaprenylglyceryl phosphate synthase [Ignisphaera sp.]|uniref:Geranylgeranylglyceryl phosphate synthase n=1 Tax=Ignisphaera aggregans TaxID=334771 RepID=A0A7C4NL72_9CREN